MAWIRVQSSVPRHPKFLEAGPSASWLWVCGLAYSQEGLTDGFIPFQALSMLGVKSPEGLKRKLVTVGLWDEVTGGWQIHDYLHHNRSADDVRQLQQERRELGSIGGKRSVEAKRLKQTVKQTVEASGQATVQPRSDQIRSEPETSTPSGEGVTRAPETVEAKRLQQIASTALPPMDEWARELVNLYPPQGRCGWNLVERPLYAVLTSGLEASPWIAWDTIRARLEWHKRSHQWRVKQMIPRLDKWLREGMYLQELPEHPVATLVNEKTTRTLASGDAFVQGVDRGSR